MDRQTLRERAPAFLAGAAAATTPVSIAISQILLGAAVLSLLLNHRQLRWPPITAPVAMFLGWTLLSVVASPDWRAGMPQVKKFYVYLMLFAVFSAVRSLKEIRYVAWGWIAGGTLSALWALQQGFQMYRATPRFFYYVYSNQSRITGFMNHWMTFSGVTMMALLIAGAMWLFDRDRGASKWLMAALVLLSVGLLAGWQRAMWVGTAVGAMRLLWIRKRVLILLVPAFAALILITNPLNLRDRAMSLIQPQEGVLDSSAHRRALRAVGWEMVKAHPLLGIGPEQVPKQFYAYAPPSVPNPVPEEWSTQHLHNLYYQYAAERGLPALAAILWMLLRALYDFAKARAANPDARWIAEGAMACILGIMVAGYGEVNLGDSEVLGMFLSILGCAYAAIRAPQKA
jgi:putative inorganic carbon (hco3(-)) transporter